MACQQQLDFFTVPAQPLPSSSALTKLYSLARFKPPLSKLIKQFKYQHGTCLASTLGGLLYAYLPLPHFSAVTWVPIHPHKQHTRGYNQAQLLAQKIASDWYVPATPLLSKTANTTAQAASTNRAERLSKQANSFALNELGIRWQEAPPASKTSVLLIDDVFTTGATLECCAQELRKIPHLEVIGCTLARA